MSYISPNTDIVLCKDVPLDNSYDHTVTFANLSAQQTYFASKAFKTLTANSYQRTMSGHLRIECSMAEAVQCNYMYFKNTSFENKYFYAFITGWEYVNNITTEITYELDVFQSFHSDMHIKACFVEREHSNTDAIGENLVPEGLEQGEYILMESNNVSPTDISGYISASACILMFCTFNDDSECTDYNGGLINYCYTALNVVVKTTLNDLNTFLTKVINKKGSLDGIVASYMCPFTPLSPSAYASSVVTWNTAIQKGYSTLNGYTPKNNKLFTSPYYTMRIRSDVDSNEYPYEYFSGDYCNFDLIGIFMPEPCLIFIPKNYKRNGTTHDAQRRTEMRMTISNFPQVALSSDVYKVYLAQNAASLRASIGAKYVERAKSFANQLGNGSIAGAVGEGASIASDIELILAQMEDIKIKPPELNGTQTSLNDYAIGAKNFYVDKLSIRAEFARIIDDYFNMFGYATHKVKAPNVTGRPHWNYVKTKGIVLDVANAPQPYVQKLQNCFNRGITFWHNPSEVGDYTLDNRPV